MNYYTDPILVFFGTEIAYAPKQFFSARLRGFSGQKRMIFPGRTVRQKTCRIKPKLDQYIKKLYQIAIDFIQYWQFFSRLCVCAKNRSA